MGRRTVISVQPGGELGSFFGAPSDQRVGLGSNRYRGGRPRIWCLVGKTDSPLEAGRLVRCEAEGRRITYYLVITNLSWFQNPLLRLANFRSRFFLLNIRWSKNGANQEIYSPRLHPVSQRHFRAYIALPLEVFDWYARWLRTQSLRGTWLYSLCRQLPLSTNAERKRRQRAELDKVLARALYS